MSSWLRLLFCNLNSHTLYSFIRLSCPPRDVFQYFLYPAYIIWTSTLNNYSKWGWMFWAAIKLMKNWQGKTKSIKSAHGVNFFVIWKLGIFFKILRVLFWSVTAIVLPYVFAIGQCFFPDLLSYKYISFTSFLVFEKATKVIESDFVLVLVLGL